MDDGQTLTAALRALSGGRRAEVRALLAPAGFGPADRRSAVAVLRAVEGARAAPTAANPIWTMPGHLAKSGPLTRSVVHMVEGARRSVTCSTYNFQRSSGLWGALRDAARRPEVTVRVYLDARAADQAPNRWSPTTNEVAAHLNPGTVLRTTEFDGGYVRNHAKFLAVDHRFLLVTSANLSWSAEHNNVEFGVFFDDANLTEAVEREMWQVEELLYERVHP
nr:DISARM system phospholipase D-like protein DrmC [Streptomonospora litoralis]